MMDQQKLIEEVKKHAKQAGLTPTEFVSEVGQYIQGAGASARKMTEDFFSHQADIQANASRLKEKMAHGARRTRGTLKFPV